MRLYGYVIANDNLHFVDSDFGNIDEVIIEQICNGDLSQDIHIIYLNFDKDDETLTRLETVNLTGHVLKFMFEGVLQQCL